MRGMMMEGEGILGDIWERNDQPIMVLYGEIGKDSCPYWIQILFKKMLEGVVTTEARNPIPVFHEPRQKTDPPCCCSLSS